MANINVTEIYGGGTTIGQVEAELDMSTNLGIIAQISGLLMRVASGSQDAWHYEHELEALESHVISNFDYPTGVKCHSWARSVRFPNGFVQNLNSQTGITYNTGNGIGRTSR